MKLEHWSKDYEHYISHKIPSTRRLLMQRILSKFEFRFIECTFTYNVCDIHKMSDSVKRESSIRSSIRKLRSITIDLIDEDPPQMFTDCRFLIARDKEPVQLQIEKLKKLKLKFYNSTFELRTRRSFFDKIWNKILLCFGPLFEYSKLGGGIVKIQGAKLRLKDLPIVIIDIAEKIAKQEESTN